MSVKAQAGLLAIDIGTSRVKLGWFPSEVSCTSEKPPSALPIASPRLPEPAETFACRHRDAPVQVFSAQITHWLEEFVTGKPTVAIASVSPDATSHILAVLAASGFSDVRKLEVSDLPIKSGLHEPARVGIDRLLAAVAINRIRSANTPVIVISLGTACTVNLISAEGVFEGGAILPGLTMAANALHEGTASLPAILPESLKLPADAIGKNTNEAMSAGIYWGLIGAIEKIVAVQSQSLETSPDLYFTGGEGPLLVDGFIHDAYAVWLVPHLVLAGIAIACEMQP